MHVDLLITTKLSFFNYHSRCSRWRYLEKCLFGTGSEYLGVMLVNGVWYIGRTVMCSAVCKFHGTFTIGGIWYFFPAVEHGTIRFSAFTVSHGTVSGTWYFTQSPIPTLCLGARYDTYKSHARVAKMLCTGSFTKGRLVFSEILFPWLM